MGCLQQFLVSSILSLYSPTLLPDTIVLYSRCSNVSRRQSTQNVFEPGCNAFCHQLSNIHYYNTEQVHNLHRLNQILNTKANRNLLYACFPVGDDLGFFNKIHRQCNFIRLVQECGTQI